MRPFPSFLLLLCGVEETWFNGSSAFIMADGGFFDPENHVKRHSAADENRVFFDHSVFEAELQDVIPICRATIAGTRVVGRLTAG